MYKLTSQLNYTTEYVDPGQMKIHIPGRFHLESFDKKEKHILLQSLCRIFHSTIIFAHLPQTNADGELTSFIDLHMMREDSLVFVPYITLEIDQSFYKASSPKHPLVCTTTLSHVGNTSYRTHKILYSPSQEKPYAYMNFVTVLTDPTTRKPRPLPQWWKDKFSSHVNTNVPAFRKTNSILKQFPQSSMPLTIYHSDTDENHHTNWTTYIRACYDVFMDGAVKKKFENITEKHAKKGVRYIEITFFKESLLGDELTVESWESQVEKDCLNFEILQGKTICCQAKLVFHDHVVESGDDGNSKL